MNLGIFALFSMHSQIKDIENNANLLNFNYFYVLDRTYSK